MSPFVLFILIFCNSLALVGSLNEEAKALLSFKQSISEDPEGTLITWNNSDENPCSWNGISCKNGRVVSLSIPKKNLFGILSPSLGSLSELRHLNLRSNRLSGSLPSGLFRALRLQGLVLYENSLSGPLPSEVGRLNYLQTLHVSHNFMDGYLPATLIHCRRLKNLDLSANNFSGILPDGFGASLASLENLNLSHNLFSGLIPCDLGNLSNLEGTLDLSHNRFRGVIPSSLGNLPEKVYIDLTYNNLSGPIPQNGALMNRGPTAFLENPGLCGPPLKNPCSSDGVHIAPSSYPHVPKSYPPQGTFGKSGGLREGAVAAIIVSDVVGICLIGLLFSYCYSRVCACGRRHDESGHSFGKKRKELLCFGMHESETLSDHVEQCDLVPLDNEVRFDLDELLKASAFVLGKSGIGIVYKVVLEGGLNLAVRRLGEGGSQRFKEFQTEVEAVGKLRHPNIVTLRAYYWSADEKLLIYEFVPNGSLSTAIHGKSGVTSFQPLSWSMRLGVMKGTAKGMVYLHEFSPKKYVHGDLKPSNILLGHDMEPKISDFGLGRIANIAGGSTTLLSNRMASGRQQQPQPISGSSELASVISTGSLGSPYQAPEAFRVMKPSQKWDVYSYGVILLEMLTGRSSLVQTGSSETDIVNWIHICIEEKKPLSDVLDQYLAEDVDKEDEMIAVLKIAMSCLHTNPERRPSMRHVLETLERLPATSVF
ncbi:unnamed protein product [Cuscuta campestris]|uniref:Protein kinase domain-containing protein n=2 Tax=Cuscuta sect. Cleistogrammica TaxID=1824901 RepID=A0A484M8L3_9ASTE|nr:hypothetical protein DM860_016846 [Cuscuta australis]VFQ84416.1 unnamed protein product [Cuscuta campestris]